MTEPDPLAEEHDQLKAERLAKDIERYYGIRASVTRRNHILTSERGLKELTAMVWADRSIDAVGRGYFLGSVEFETAADWTFDPLSVVLARLAAIMLITFRVRRIVNAIDHILTRKAPK